MKHPFSYILTGRYKIHLLKQLLPKGSKRSLLDIGCGSGFILSQIEYLFEKTAGVDLSKEALSLAKKYTGAKLLKASAQKLPFNKSAFDVVISTDVFEHIVDDKRALKEVKRVLKPGGIFIIYVPCQKGLLSKTSLASLFHTNKKNYMRDQRYYTIESLTKLLKEAGLKIEYIGYHNVFFQEFFTQLLKWASFKLGKKYETQADIKNFINSNFFPFYRWLLLPIVDFLVFVEDFICQNLFKSKIPGHRIIVKCRKTK